MGRFASADQITPLWRKAFSPNGCIIFDSAVTAPRKEACLGPHASKAPAFLSAMRKNEVRRQNPP
ncbi:MAG: hypothetical protein C4519_05385 [Desulfobacteraceae bacterium]|nr:MAG: hypothetical protein C4519_05385 [Desulfobacteraceae bacterium]